MKLEQQVVSLDFAKRLKELGVKQESLYRWVQDPNEHADPKSHYLTQPQTFQDGWSAFTVAELGEMFPPYIIKDGLSLILLIIRSSVWRLHYGDPSQKESVIFTAFTNDSEADARARFLAYLLENKFIAL